jgi:transcriptional antiterminator RfaH
MIHSQSVTEVAALREVALPPINVGVVQPLTEPPMAESAPAASYLALQPWYVCLTKPRQEAYAVLKLREQGYEVVLPMLHSWTRQAGRWARKQSVMFPRYAFVRPARPSQGVWAVRSTPGVTTLVKFGPVLACMRPDRLAALQSILAERAAALPQQPLQPGQQVVFATGPLQGLSGIISDVASERVTVLMALLGQDQRVSARTNELVLA